MGVTIHYRGRLDDIKKLPVLCDEMIDIAKVMGWKYARLDDDWSITVDAKLDGNEITGNLGLKGIYVLPHPKSEPLYLFFDCKGNIHSPIGRILFLEKRLKPKESWVFIKTQFSSPDVHIRVIGLLKYLKKKYISNLEVRDEGEYWEKADFKILKEKMDFINSKINYLSSELSSDRLGDIKGLSAEEIAARIERLLKKQ